MSWLNIHGEINIMHEIHRRQEIVYNRISALGVDGGAKASFLSVLGGGSPRFRFTRPR